MLNISCDIIRDLIPLVKDGVASDDSVIIVNEHINACASCKSEFETLDVINPLQSSIKDAKIISAMKRSIFVTQIIILILGGIFGVALSDSMGMFYNFTIMPIIGGVSVVALKRKWYLTPIVIFIISYLWTALSEIVTNGFEWIFLYGGLYYATIYTVLVLLGVLIAMLLKITFKKER